MGDSRPGVESWRPAWRLGLCTFGILALELALIRWLSGQIRIFAYFSNLVLMAAFLGMGLGVAAGRQRPHLVKYCLPVLTALSILLAFSVELKVVHMVFPDPAVSLWGSDVSTSPAGFLAATAILMSLFWVVTLIFVLAAAPIGTLFNALPPLKAYSADLLGSLLGIVAMTAIAAAGLSPVWWMIAGTLPFVLLSRKWYSVVFSIAVVVLAGLSVKGAIFSPYNRIDIAPGDAEARVGAAADLKPEWVLQVNRDFHQTMLDLSDRTVGASPPQSDRRVMQTIYNLPFSTSSGKERALIVGAGSGNDVAAALRCGFKEAVSVDIDGTIVALGRRMHPEAPYSDPRVKAVINDARAYFEQNPDERFDVVCYGLLDSHAMFSAMSSLRLDNYVYTVEGIRAGWEHVKDGGTLSVCFSGFAGEWIVQRMHGLVQQATGRNPIVVPHGLHFGVTYLVGSNIDPAKLPAGIGRVIAGATPDPAIRIPTDDWPFLYLKPGAVPYAYIVVLFLVLLTAFLGVRATYGRDLFTARRFDVPLFLMGAAFMLLETRMVTELSLLFGSTWIVNSCVFGGILLVVLAANAAVERREPARIAIWYVPLIVSLLIAWATGAGVLNRLPLVPRGIVGGILYALPVGFAGVIFSKLLKHSRDPAASLGSNLIGAVLGGTLEYISMFAGLKATALLALGFYMASLLYLSRHPASASGSPGAPVEYEASPAVYEKA